MVKDRQGACISPCENLGDRVTRGSLMAFSGIPGGTGCNSLIKEKGRKKRDFRIVLKKLGGEGREEGG